MQEAKDKNGQACTLFVYGQVYELMSRYLKYCMMFVFYIFECLTNGILLQDQNSADYQKISF